MHFISSEFIEYEGYQRDTVNWPGLGGVIGFYIAILLLGFYASWRSKSFRNDCTIEELTLAGRDIGPLMGIFTMTGEAARWLLFVFCFVFVVVVIVVVVFLNYTCCSMSLMLFGVV